MRRVAVSVVMSAMLAAAAPQAQTGRNPEIQKLGDAFAAAWAKGDAKAIAAEAMRVAATICVYTNDQVMVEVL